LQKKIFYNQQSSLIRRMPSWGENWASGLQNYFQWWWMPMYTMLETFQNKGGIYEASKKVQTRVIKIGNKLSHLKLWFEGRHDHEKNKDGWRFTINDSKNKTFNFNKLKFAFDMLGLSFVYIRPVPFELDCRSRWI